MFAACCQNGLGVSKGTLSGILAAEYACGLQNPYIEDYLNEAQPTHLPPEPLVIIGATAYLNWQEWRAGLQKKCDSSLPDLVSREYFLCLLKHEFRLNFSQAVIVTITTGSRETW
jgi:hypothetical protein